MTLPHPLPDPLVELIAKRFRVIGEPMRIRLLDRLREGEASVHELTEATGATQQNVSKHLGVLHAAGIVARRKEGTRTVYAIADDSVLRALRARLRKPAAAVRGARRPAREGRVICTRCAVSASSASCSRSRGR